LFLCFGSNQKVGKALMPRRRRGPLWFSVLIAVLLFGWSEFRSEEVLAASSSRTSGTLEILAKDGSVQGLCPLKHTEVRGAISGFLARVSVTQVFGLSPERRLLESKLHPGLLDAYDCVVKKSAECNSVKDGEIRVQLWTSADTPAVREALLKSGFQLANAISGNSFIGTIAVEKLALLEQVPELRFASVSSR
jgi:hypothetical protein